MHVNWCVKFSFAWVLQSLSSHCTLPCTYICRHTRTPQQLYPHHLCTPTCSVPYTPLHTQQLYPHHFTRTTCAHPHVGSHTHPYKHSCHTYTHTPVALPAPPVHTLTPTYKYLHISIAHNCHNPYLQISINIHIPPITILTIKIQSLQSLQ